MRIARFIGIVGVAAAGSAGGADLAATSGWVIKPAVALQEVFTDNSEFTQGNQQSDAITELVPQLTIIGETARSSVLFVYAPTFEHFDFGTAPDRVDQSLDASGSFIPFTDYLTINVAATASEAGGSGNLGQSQLAPSNDRVLYYGGSIAPHFQDHFGDVATIDAYYKVRSSNTSQQSQQTTALTVPSTNSLTRDAELIIGSAESFGRLSVKLDLDHVDGGGSGRNTDFNTDLDVINLEYHINHAYSVIGSIGYQKIHYAASIDQPVYNNEGLTFTAGFQFAPTEASTITATYGLEQGNYSPTLRMTYAVSNLTAVSASYVVSTENQLQSALQNLEFLTHDAAGNPIDSRTGLPFTAVNTLYGSQNVLFRDKSAIVTLEHQFTRSVLTMMVTYDTRTSISGLPARDEAAGLSIDYNREITPVIRGGLDIGFTDHETTGFIGYGNEHAQLINFGATLTYSLNEATTAYLTETYFDRISNLASNGSSTNQLTIGLRREF